MWKLHEDLVNDLPDFANYCHIFLCNNFYADIIYNVPKKKMFPQCLLECSLDGIPLEKRSTFWRSCLDEQLCLFKVWY